MGRTTPGRVRSGPYEERVVGYARTGQKPVGHARAGPGTRDVGGGISSRPYPAAASRHPPKTVTARFAGSYAGPARPSRAVSRYSHSIVAGGFDEMSSATRLTPGTSLMIRVEIVWSTSQGSRAQSAVIASSEVTALITIG